LTSFTAFSCSLITAGLVQAGFDASASAPRLVRPTSPTPGAQEVTALEPRMPIERELAGAQKHSYQLGLTQGQYVSLTVDQRGIDVLVRMFGPDGKLIADCDSADGLKGLEDPELVADVPGIYTFEVVAKRKDAPVGRYEIKITELRAAVERDRLLLQARISHREGV
jgi:hypothetical protein